MSDVPQPPPEPAADTGTGTEAEALQVSSLVSTLMLHSAEFDRRMLNGLAQQLLKENKQLRQTIQMMRDQVCALLDGRFMPTHRAIMDALYPEISQEEER